MTDMQTIYIVDEQGATFWSRDKAEAERILIDEAWRGAVHLVIGKADAPVNLTDRELDDWATRNAPEPGCDQ